MDYKNTRSDEYTILKKSGRNGKKLLQSSILLDDRPEPDLLKAEYNGSKIKDVLCFSHLRWNFVFQRPQHLLTRWAKESRVIFFEEPVSGNFETNFLKMVFQSSDPNLIIITPHIKNNFNEHETNFYLKQSVEQIINWYNVEDYLLWYLTPMAVRFTEGLNPRIIVYDSMDELSGFKGAHHDMLTNEEKLFKIADVVFTGGYNLYEHKKHRHHNIHPFPSSVDQRHFESGLRGKNPSDQENIPHPRVGFFGVIDERLDIDLLDGLARKMPDVHFIMIGPVVKIDETTLPNYSNIHYLGMKSYDELPFYLANWDAAFLPFAKNESTRFISPTKTPEYLCAEKRVVSTSIHDVVIPYGEMGMVEIADTVSDFSSALRKVLTSHPDDSWLMKVKDFLKMNSWDLTWSKMKDIIYETLEQKDEMEMTFSDKGLRLSSGT